MSAARFNRSVRTWLLLVVSLALVAPAGTAFARPGSSGPDASIDAVRSATARFHSVQQAGLRGYEEFLGCFDSPDGGMGQHFVNFDLLLDPAVDALQPEAMVYEVRGGRLFLVGVEYIVPGDFVDPEAPPELFGRHFHLNPSLGVWVLHAWVWRENPSGMFADYNPNVRRCP